MTEQQKGSESYHNDQMSFHDQVSVEIGGFPKQEMQLRLTDITLKTPSPATIKIQQLSLKFMYFMHTNYSLMKTLVMQRK